MAIALQPQEINLKKKLEESFNRIRSFVKNWDFPENDFKKIEDQMGELAHELHVSLKKRGLEPKHHKYMIKNRGISPEHPDFYKHIHPAEDLLKFLADPHANDDPEDMTIGDTFELRIYSRRWGHDDIYRLTRSVDGWSFQGINGGLYSCDKGVRPRLIEALNHDCIVYPNDIDGFFEWLWNQAHDKGLSKEQVQQAMDQLAEWVSQTEKTVPRGGVWEGYC